MSEERPRRSGGGAAGPLPVAVAVVDDDAMSRAGAVAILAASRSIAVVFAGTHDEALDPERTWPAVDVLLLDAADDRRDDDHFPGVRVAQRFRRDPSLGRARIIVITGHFLDGALRERMREAGADFLYNRLDLRDENALIEAVVTPEAARRVPPPLDQALLRQMGITPSSKLNLLIEHAEQSGAAKYLVEDQAPIGGPPPRSRAWLRLRTEAAAAGRIDAVNTDGTLPRRDQDIPSLGQLRRVYTWATRVKKP